MSVTSHPVRHSLALRRGVSRADLGMVFVALTWGVNYPLVKSAIAAMDPLVFNALRMVVAMVAMPLMALLMGVKFRGVGRDLWKFLALGLLGNTGYQLFFIFGIERTTASNASLMLSTSPVQVALFGALLGLERVGKVGWLGVFSAFAGIALLVIGKGETLAFGGASLLGDFLVLCGCATWALYTLGIRPLIHRYGALRTAVLTVVLGVWPLVLLSLPRAVQEDWSRVGWSPLAVATFSGLFAIAISYMIWNVAVRNLGATRTAVYGTLPPVITALVDWLWLGQHFSGLQWLGAALTLAGVTLTRLPAASPSQEEMQGEEGT
ncbi:MAG: DMT family transporter [Anaerolineae bacterium]